MNKRLGNVKRVATFAPALADKFIEKYWERQIKNFKKSLKKIWILSKEDVIFATRKKGSSLKIMRLKRDENFLKKKFQKVLVIKKRVLLLHPLTARMARLKRKTRS